jgi:hypothetical protein
MRKTVLLLVACMIAATTAAKADIVIGTTVRGGNDLADWGQLGACGTDIPNNFGAVSNGGVGITGTFGQGGPGQLRQQSNPNCVWNGNFASGDYVLWTNSPGQAPLTLSFSRGVSGAGAQIQADFPGAFTAQVCDNFGDCFQENGNSNFNGDNSAIFIGMQDLTGPDITSFTFSLTSCVSDCNDFGINQLSLGPTPEPGTFVLFCSGLLSLSGLLRRRISG